MRSHERPGLSDSQQIAALLDVYRQRLIPGLRDLVDSDEPIDDIHKKCKQLFKEQEGKLRHAVSKPSSDCDPESHPGLTAYAAWRRCADYYSLCRRHHDALLLLDSLYEELCALQIADPKNPIRIHKGDTLWALAGVYDELGYAWHARRFRLLALIEDAITCEPKKKAAEDESEKPGTGVPASDADLKPLTGWDRFRTQAAAYPFLRKEIRMRDDEIEALLPKLEELAHLGGPALTALKKLSSAIGDQLELFPECALSLLRSVDPEFHDRTCTLPDYEDEYFHYNVNKIYSSFLNGFSRTSIEFDQRQSLAIAKEKEAKKALEKATKDAQQRKEEAEKAAKDAEKVRKELDEVAAKVGGTENHAALNDTFGKAFELLMLHFVSCLPGSRVLHNVETKGQQHDLVCCLDGYPPDFRSELGRYFLCECKNKTESAVTSDLGTFANSMSDRRTKFGIYFSRKGATGDREKYQSMAANQVIKMAYTIRDTTIAVINDEIIKKLCDNKNSLNLIDELRRQYEKVGFDKRS